jgi:membrane protein DedA with SNARE-associated domain
LPPLAGVVLSILAYAAQNVWHVFHIQEVADALHGFGPAGLAIAVFLIGATEGTVILSFYVPGTAVLVLLLLGLQPPWNEALLLLGALMAGTLLGFGASVALGRALKRRLPRLVGRAAYRRMRYFLKRFGIVVVAATAFHPNPLALAFAIVGYLRVGRLWQYFAVAVLAQAVWWSLYASSASLLSQQTIVTGNNFQLVLAGLFSVWFVYELMPEKQGKTRRETDRS